MKEAIVWIALCAIFVVLVVVEGKRNLELEAKIALSPKELYQKLARSKVRLQLVDVRQDAESYEDAHIPGAVPFPACDPSAAPEHVVASVPSVIISDEGDPRVFDRCRSYFTMARNLAGGMAAWTDENYPEDVGEYSPPRSSAGGGCL